MVGDAERPQIPFTPEEEICGLFYSLIFKKGMN
jgi:hypothetical protein